MKLKKFISITLFLILVTALVTAIFAAPSFAADEKKDTGSAWNIYFRPGVRFGTESRVLYIMDFLIPLYQDENNIFFSNIKYTPNDHDGWELNLGAGYRRLLLDDKLLLGLNAYYDKRKTDWGTNHEQWGVGLEAMADIPLEAFNLGLTGRFNYYYPLSHTKIDGLGTAYASYALSDSGIILTGGRVEEPMRGFDYEGGVRIPYLSDYVETWAYAGGYHYKGRRVRDINGFMARLEIIPTDFMRLNYEFHHDNYSKAEHYGEFTLEVPFSVGNLVTGKNPFEGIGDVFTGSRELSARMVEPVRRDVDVKVVVDNDNDNIPSGGDEIEDVVFVSETGSDVTGDGTIKNPYATISHALASDARIISGACKTIHVMNSDPTAVIDEAAGAGLTLGVADFLLWGSGVNHPKHPVSNMPYTGHPTINDTLVLNAANPNVTGLGFDVTGDNHCIDILNGNGVKITNNEFKISFGGLAYGIRADIGTGIGTAANPIIIANNSFDVTSTGDNAYGINLHATNVDGIFAKIIGNDMSNTIWGADNAYGIVLAASGGGVIGSETSPVIILGNPMTVTGEDNDAYGILLNADRDIFAYVTKNDMSNTIEGAIVSGAVYGIRLNSSLGNIGSETRPVIISGNPMTVTANNGDAYGISIENSAAAPAGNIFAAITNNDMTGMIRADDEARGINLESISGNVGSATTPVIISGNPMIVTGYNSDAYGVNIWAGDNLFAGITGNYMGETASGGSAIHGLLRTYGIRLRAAGGDMGSAASPVIVSGNPISVTSTGTSVPLGNAYGIRLEGTGINSDIFAYITGNDLSGNIRGEDYAYGISLYNLGRNIGSETCPVIVSGNTITSTATVGEAYGVSLWSDLNVFAAVTGNDLSNTITGGNDSTGVLLYSDGGNIGSGTSPVIVSGNPMTVAATGTTATESAYGIRLHANGASPEVFATITGNDMSGDINAQDYAYGIYILNGGGGIGSAASPVIISGNTITATTSVDQSIGMFLFSGLDLFASITGNDLSNTITGADYVAGIHLYTGGGSIGSETTPVIIAGNPITVNGPYAATDSYGMYLDANGVGANIFANIVGNDMSGGVYGVNEAYGIYMESINIGSGTNPVILSENPMTVTAALAAGGSIAHGIYLNSIDDIFAGITGNDMSNTITANAEVCGIRLNSSNGNIGSALRPVIISGNPITATTNTGVITSDAYGIWIQAPAAAAGNIFASITGNDMSNTITGADHVYGMYILGNSVGSATSPILISGNSIAATSTGNEGYGIYIQSPGDIYGSIIGNNMLDDIYGANRAWGISVFSSSGSVGSATSPFVISRNAIDASVNNNGAYGISLQGAVDIFTSMLSNYMEVASASGNAYGAYVVAGNLIGNVASRATYFLDNSGTVNGATNTYMLYLDTGNTGGGNYISWYDNSFIPLSGAWTGNYGPNNELAIFNFDLVGGDVITP